MPSAHLPDRSLILIAGAEAQSFLQGIITTDVDALVPGESRPGALLTPQGKILFDFNLWRDGDSFQLECDAGHRDGLIRRLTMYKLRAAVTLGPGQTGVTVIWGDAAKGAAGVIDGAFDKTGILVKRQPGSLAPSDGMEVYDALRIEAGLALSGRDFALQDAFPHDVLLDLDGGLSFRKGCYVGQEVVSRMQHRGTARRRVAQVTGQTELPGSGTELMAGGKPVGTLGTVAGSRGLAIVRIDRVGAAIAGSVPILAGETPVTLALPQWSGLAFPIEASEAEQ
jgi:folate-binding protein YgfZ